MAFGYSEFAVHRWYGMRVPRNAACPTCNESAFLSQLLAETQVRWE